MAVGVPTGRIGAEYPLGYGIQSTLGTPVPVTNYINQTANTLKYVTGMHMLKTAMGSRADEQESAFGETHVEGGFESNLRTATMRGLLEAFFGLGTVAGSPAVDTISVTRPQLLTIEDNWAGESHQYQDCLLNTLKVSCTNHLEVKMAWTLLGGLQTLITSTAPTGLTGGKSLAWADITGWTGWDVVPCNMGSFDIDFNNGVKLWYGAGQSAACAVLGGEFLITGTVTLRYDGSLAAQVQQAYVAGTDLGPSDLTIGGAGVTASGTATEASGGVTGVTVTNGGSGYNSAPSVTFTGGGGTGAAGTAVVTNGAVTGVTITSPGTGYTSAPTVAFGAPGGNQHVLHFPNITLLDVTSQKPLDDWMTLSVQFGVKSAQNFTWACPDT